MTKAAKFSSRPSGVKILLIGVLISVCSLIICSLLGAAILVTADDPVGSVGIYSLVALLVSGALSGAVVPKFAGNIPRTALCALFTALLMLLCGLIISGVPSFGAFMNCGCYFGIFVLTAVLVGMRKKTRGHRKHKR